MRQVPVRFYAAVSEVESVGWSWVDEQLGDAPTYWVSTGGSDHPHPRPVWGVWHDDVLWLSVGSPTLRAAIAAGASVTVHVGSGEAPVIVEGDASTDAVDQSAAIAAYDAKYTWAYDVAEYGALVRIVPATVLAWQSSGFAGRDGFQRVGKWVADG